jgi:hypothetical protein
MEKENSNYGNLFGTIDLLSEEHLEAILMSIDNDHAIYYLIESVKCAYKRGSFTIGECEIISKTIRVLSKTEEPTKNNDK